MCSTSFRTGPCAPTRSPNISSWKKWPNWLIVRGDSAEDKDYLAQIERSAKRYGGKIVQETVYPFPPGSRNTDSGYQQVQAQIPTVTESAPDHDVVWVIDTDDFFGDYFPYRTYRPDLVVGTQGLQALAWDKSYTEYGVHDLPGRHIQARQARRRPSATTRLDWAARLDRRGDAVGQDHRAGAQGLYPVG